MPLNENHFNSLYSGENQQQAINRDAAAIEEQTNVSVVRCHLGNPLGPPYIPSDDKVAEYISGRSKYESNRGYADVAGHKSLRTAAAAALTRINRLEEDEIEHSNILAVTGGTGALNITTAIFNDATLLVPEPYYPPWKSISDKQNCNYEKFPLTAEDDFLLNYESLHERLTEISNQREGKPIVLTYHYPQNPTGKTLSEVEAKKVANTLNKLTAEFPDLYLLQEDLYLGTVAKEEGIYTPLPHLNTGAKERTIWLNSPSKIGHPQEWAAIAAAFNPELTKRIRGSSSFAILGTSSPAFVATTNTLLHIAQGGVDAVTEKTKDNHRFVTADYYQERLKIMVDAFQDVENKANTKLLTGGMPKGAYYLYPSFDCLRGKDIPEELLHIFDGKKTFENSDDLALALKNAHLPGLRPVTISPGSLFTDDKSVMTMRIATVETDIQKTHSAANTFKGIIQKTLDIELDAEFKSGLDELNEAFPIETNVEKFRNPFLLDIKEQTFSVNPRFR